MKFLIPAPRFLASTVAVEAEHGTHAGLLIVDRENKDSGIL